MLHKILLLRGLGYLLMAGMTVAFVQSTLTTFNLVRVDAGLHSSLESTKQLVHINRAIIANNKSLPQVVAKSKQTSHVLETTLSATTTVQQHIQQINELNSQTLRLNQKMASTGQQTGQSLQNVVQSTQALRKYLEGVQQNLVALKQITDTDRHYLNEMKQSADQMNTKTPGVG